MLYNLSDYLFARTTGYIGSLMDLVSRAAARAIRTGSERIDQALLDRIPIDAAAEAAFKDTRATIAYYRKTGRLPPELRA
ncbi:hypothetical protein [Microbacterium sp.]|uniref:hypothetical protein n=1 Tax=Microbacterium sp. TaxID=51671 RepID=UPI0037354F70